MRSILSVLLVLSTINIANSTEFRSSTTPVSLIELYTSEGCSSCPAANHWLSSLQDHPKLWQDFVPIALHVDYWNYLGWKDQFSRSVYSDRQRQYHHLGASRSVYTPAFMINGREWRGYFSGKTDIAVPKTETGILTLKVNGKHYRADYTPTHDQSHQPLSLMVALLGMDLNTHVTRGENRGRTLHHDFVVLDLKRANGTMNQWHGSLPIPHDDQQYAVAAWVTEATALEPLQAIGGLLDTEVVGMTLTHY